MAIITKCFSFFLFLVMAVSEAGNLRYRYHTTVRRAWHKVPYWGSTRNRRGFRRPMPLPGGLNGNCCLFAYMFT